MTTERQKAAQRGSGVSAADYDQAQWAWDRFGCHTFAVLLLADEFESYRARCYRLRAAVERFSTWRGVGRRAPQGGGCGTPQHRAFA